MARVNVKKRKSIVNTAVIISVILLALYLAIQLFGGGAQNVSTVRAQNITDNGYITFNGYVIRDEHLIYAEDGYVADFTVGNGDRVGKDQEYLRYYKTGLDAKDILQAQRTIDDFSDKIDVLSDSLSGNFTVADVKDIKQDLNAFYSDMLDYIAKGDYSDANKKGEDLLGEINNYDAAMGEQSSKGENLSQVKEKKQEYIDSIAISSPESVYAGESCYIFNCLDGYESVFDYANILSVTPDGFSDTVNQAKPQNPRGAIGKKIINSEWFFALRMNASQLKHFEEGGEYELEFINDGGVTIKMTVEKIYIPDKNIGKGFIVFSSRDIAIGADISRYTSVRVNTGTVSGYRVPEDAVTQIDADGDGIYDHIGVFVLSGNRVEFRRVEEIASGAGYVIVKTAEKYEADLEEKKNRPLRTEQTSDAVTEEVSEGESQSEEATTRVEATTKEVTDEEKEQDFPYLSLNELIILAGGGELYDGKILK